MTTSGYPDALYYAYNSLRPNLAAPGEREGSAVSVSLDGGKTFSLPVVAHPRDACTGGINGPVAVAPDGAAMLPTFTCDGVDVSVSHDAGKTWKVAHVNGAGALQGALDPSVAVDAAGHAFVAFTGKDGASYLSASRDDGATWSAPVRASPPDVNATALTIAVAGADGRVALAYYGTSSDPRAWPSMDPSTAPDGTLWHLYMTQTSDALDAAPRFTTTRVTPADDPAQVGCIWLQGGVNDCRNIGDFIGMTQVGGRPYVVYVDGCDKSSTAATSHGSAVWVARAEGGESLLGGALAPLGPAKTG